MTDLRVALADFTISQFADPCSDPRGFGELSPEDFIADLAERGVLLVPAEFVATIQRMIEDGHPNDREWFDIVVRALAALSGEVTK